MIITGKTRVLGLLGYPVEQSLSPVMHNAAFERVNLDYCYVTFSVQPGMLKEAVDGIRALNLKGVNVTVPYKEDVIPLLEDVSEEALSIGAVNTIRNDDGRLTGYNTDGKGFMQSLSEADIAVKDKRILIVGAGGASRAIGYYLCREAAVLYLYDLDMEKAAALKKSLSRHRGEVLLVNNTSAERRDFFSEIDIIINATPLGLRSDDPPPVDISLLNDAHIVCDLIYKNTALLAAASNIGCKTLDGLGMLLWQGVYAFEIWTGLKPPIDVMRGALIKER
ncbi:shikimate dehydrogenase [Thermodesulfovibrionales bacterium]|nr:shikimate dehydrogenase [Thermodesulfovibrionales bacterium]